MLLGLALGNSSTSTLPGVPCLCVNRLQSLVQLVMVGVTRVLLP